MSALRRWAGRMARKLAGPEPAPRRRTFGGATVGRLLAKWFVTSQSANQQIEGDLKLLRERSRQLCRDNPHAKQYLHLLRTNVAGPHGITLQAQFVNSRGKPHKKFNRDLELLWDRWTRSDYCTVDGRLSWAELLQAIDEHEARDGEALLRRVRDADNKHGYALQLLDADQLDESKNQAPSKNLPEIRMGVELGPRGRPTFYHCFRRHPNDRHGGRDETVPIPADQILHVFQPLGAGAVRGVPWFAPVLVRLHHIDEWATAAITAARIGASKMGFFVDKREDAGASYEAPEGDDGRIQMDIEPGTFGQLPPGIELETFDATYPNWEYDNFERAHLRAVAVGLGISYTSLTNDLNAVNYSSARVGMLAERDHFRTLQARRIEHVCRIVFRDWLASVVAAGLIVPPTYDLDAIAAQMVWQPRGFDWVDPRNEALAVKEKIALGLTSRTKVAAEMGIDYQDTLEQLALEQELADEAGVPINGLTPGGQTQETKDDDDAEAGAAGGAAPNDEGRSVRLLRRLG